MFGVRPLTLVALLAASNAHAADTASIAQAMHESRWADADTAAAALPDPVARKLVLFYRLLTQGAGRPAEIAAFMADNPNWPDQPQLSRRLQEAITAEGDDRTVLDICARQVPREVPSMLRCAEADSRAGRAPDAAELARQAWLTGVTDPVAETAFLKRWGPSLTFFDQWRRFDRLAWTDNGAVGGPAWRQVTRLDPSQRPSAEARLALKRDDPLARHLVAALPPAAQIDPALMLELAKWLRRAGIDEDAQKLWLAMGQAAERAAPPEWQAAFWAERNLLARRRLRAPDPAGAYALADQAVQTAVEPAADAHFLAGFIALRRLGDTDDAARHFTALAALSKAAITQARAYYWLGRTADARHDASAARGAYAAAAVWTTTFYGQLAARALGDDGAQLAARIRASHDRRGSRTARSRSPGRNWRARPPCCSPGTSHAGHGCSSCASTSWPATASRARWLPASPPATACRISRSRSHAGLGATAGCCPRRGGPRRSTRPPACSTRRWRSASCGRKAASTCRPPARRPRAASCS